MNSPFEPKSIAEQIDCLARLTGAPRSFVCQVKELFSRKGIDLDSDAAPYLRALEEAFKREESIRASANRARNNIAALHENFNKIGKSYVKQLERLREMQSNLKSRSERLRRHYKSQRSNRGNISIPGSHRSVVTRQQSDEFPMVPGPEEPQ
jgi:DNA repair exonuclease SbcCD ATPase subunit